MRVIFLVLLGFLAACDSPSPSFMGPPPIVITIEQSTFAVHRRLDRVEVYRTSFEFTPDRAGVLRRAERAIEQATGCTVRARTLVGDQALIRATLDCTE